MKILVGIACLLGLFTMPMTTNVQAAESTNAPTPIVRKLNMPEEQKTVYTYSDEGGEYTFTILSETEILVEGTSESGEVITLMCAYELKDNILTLFVDGSVWSQFTVNEDNTLTVYEEVEEVPEDTETNYEDIDIEEELTNLQLLIEALKNELAEETFNADNLAKILIAMAGTLGSILLVLLFRILKAKILNLKNNEEYEKAKKAMEEEFAKYQAEVKELISSLELKVVKKIDDTEEKRQKQIESQSVALSETIEKVKKNLSIDEILNDE